MTAEREKGVGLTEACGRLGITPEELAAAVEEGIVAVTREGGVESLSPREFERLEVAVRIQRDLGVNLPGADVILEMREKMIRMRSEVDQILDFIRRQVEKDLRDLLGEEDFPLALGPGERFLSIERGGKAPRRGGRR